MDKFADILKIFKGKVYKINESISQYLTESVTSSGIFAFVKVNDNSKIVGDKILVLDNLQDPSNLGSIIRSAMAFDFKSIIMINGVYPYSAKVIRSSMRYVFDINIISYVNSKNETIEFEVKKYLPIEEKMEMISNIINQSVDDNGFYNPMRIKIFTTLEVIYAYTNLNFTAK